MKYTFFLLLLIVAPIKADEAKNLIQGNNQFAVDLYTQLRETKENLLYSPFSISTALGMTSLGARDETLKQMLATLHLPEGESTHASFAKLIKDLNGDDLKKRGFELSVANALWGQQGNIWEKNFLDLTQKHYGAGLNEVDFLRNSEDARKTINSWVADRTQNKIQELLKKGFIKSDTELVLTNAIYFKGNWATQFDPKFTKDGSFQIDAKQKIVVPFMVQRGEFNFLENDDLQLLEMPYKNKELSMLILLPKKVDGLESLEKSLSSDNLREWSSKMGKQKNLRVSLPKFKFESDFSLAQTLPRMGMKNAFIPGKADFSGLNGKKNLVISDVIHKAFIEVNEQGTEAAAATAVIIGRGASKSPSFQADHPFLFAIRHNSSGSLLFLGRVVEPK
jgi:serine protease inhibitor